MTGLGAVFASLVTDGSLVVGVLVAVLAGAVSFASPCVLPLIPGYLGYVAGLAGGATAQDTTARDTTAQDTTARDTTARDATDQDTGRQAQVSTTVRLGEAVLAGDPRSADDRPATGGATAPLEPPAPADVAVATTARQARRAGVPDGQVHATAEPAGARVMLGASLFVLGFTVVFVSFGAVFGGLGRVLLEWAPLLTRVMGVITILMGLAFMGVIPWLQRERRIHALPRAGLAGAPILGVVFGLGWTPCLGPTLAAVSTLAYSQASATRGAILGLGYCLGLGIPFLAVALGFKRAMRMSAWARRHARTVMRAGGILLVVLGLLLLTGAWDQIMIWMRSWLATTGLGTSSI